MPGFLRAHDALCPLHNAHDTAAVTQLALFVIFVDTIRTGISATLLLSFKAIHAVFRDVF